MESWLLRLFAGDQVVAPVQYDAVRDFCVLWAVFEGSLLKGKWSVDDAREAVGRLVSHGAIAGGFEEARDYFRERFLVGPDHELRWDMLGIPPVARDFVMRCLTTPTVALADLVTALLIIAWRFRANLFHGEEWQRGEPEPLLSFQHAMLIVLMVLNAAGLRMEPSHKN
jgi:hypothetical protein